MHSIMEVSSIHFVVDKKSHAVDRRNHNRCLHCNRNNDIYMTLALEDAFKSLTNLLSPLQFSILDQLWILVEHIQKREKQAIID